MHLLIQGCKRNDRDSQRLLYQHYYSYALAICLRYSRSAAEAKEVVNDGFLKVFDKIDRYNVELPFKAWLRKIMINASIDQYRKELKHAHQAPVEQAQLMHSQPVAVSNLSHDELIALVQKLTPAYRAVFNLYVIDGYTHREIGKLLNIAEGTSKSNLLKARENLRSMLDGMNEMPYGKAN
ncbi:MAG TPA: RNA polymerase subunit sigma-70 [Cytophagales bacterium]|nr:RNA polymerase subunit sigma-70 [Cytophagales bacterium]HRG09418.1 sigma-70 family RNA polymerase sigma factor [Cyclobacteriaceae bacterium]